MKRVLLSVCFSAILLSACGGKGAKSNNDANTPVEIPDANFGAYLLENFDQNNDGVITVSEAEAVKDINCSGKEIADLTGIEKFANLESLNCSNNKLDELELRYNKKLNKLVCTGNNTPLTIYIGMSSPLRNQNVQRPKNNEPPSTANMMLPLDVSKCTFDHNSTNIYLSFDE
ncbi:MAG: hypothetical protein LBR18_08390 [Tannerella sp.]|jgi:Leucine-rich repeat (LRR) protein|nr:hypothetical protein [Tannerella sp.]